MNKRISSFTKASEGNFVVVFEKDMCMHLVPPNEYRQTYRISSESTRSIGLFQNRNDCRIWIDSVSGSAGAAGREIAHESELFLAGEGALVVRGKVMIVDGDVLCVRNCNCKRSAQRRRTTPNKLTTRSKRNGNEQVKKGRDGGHNNRGVGAKTRNNKAKERTI